MRGVGFLIIWSFTVQLLFREFAKGHSLLRSAKGIDPGLLYRSVGVLSAVNALGDGAVTPDPYPHLYESAELAVSWVTAGKSLTTTSAKRSATQTFRYASAFDANFSADIVRHDAKGNEPSRWSCVAHARNKVFQGSCYDR